MPYEKLGGPPGSSQGSSSTRNRNTYNNEDISDGFIVKSTWPSLFLSLLKTVAIVAGGAVILLLIMYSVFMYSVYEVISSASGNLMFGTGWWYKAPFIAGMLGLLISDMLAYIIFIGFFKRNKIASISVMGGLVLISMSGQYYVRDTRLVGSFLCSGDPAKGFYMSDKPIDAFTQEACLVVTKDMIYSAKAFADGKRPNRINISSIEQLKTLPLSVNGKPVVFVSNNKLANGDYVFYDGAGASETHTKRNPDLLIPATEEHRGQNIGSIVKSSLDIAYGKISTLRIKKSTMPKYIHPNELTVKNPTMKIPEYYYVSDGKNIVESTTDLTVTRSCYEGSVFAWGWNSIFPCQGLVIFRLNSGQLDLEIDTQQKRLAELKEMTPLGTNLGADLNGPAPNLVKKEMIVKGPDIKMTPSFHVPETIKGFLTFVFESNPPMEKYLFPARKDRLPTRTGGKVLEGSMIISITGHCSIIGVTIQVNEGPLQNICSLEDLVIEKGSSWVISNDSPYGVISNNIKKGKG